MDSEDSRERRRNLWVIQEDLESRDWGNSYGIPYIHRAYLFVLYWFITQHLIFILQYKSYLPLTLSFQTRPTSFISSHCLPTSLVIICHSPVLSRQRVSWFTSLQPTVIIDVITRARRSDSAGFWIQRIRSRC